jgi:ribosomal-protein-alanine N-acetyltransferase
LNDLSNLTITDAGWRDIGDLRRLEQICFPKDAWPLIDLIGILTLPGVVRIKATIREEMIAFIAGDRVKSQREARIATIGVLPAFREMGVGTLLIEEFESRVGAERIELCVRFSNKAAIRMYRTLGFKESGLWSKYYIDGEDALVMEKRL